MILPIVSVSVAILLAGLFITVRAIKGAGISGLLSKILASFAFVMAGIFATIASAKNNTMFVFIILGLVCGLIGDIILELKVVYKKDSDEYLPYGMIAFGFGHLLYFLAINYLAKTELVETSKYLFIALGISIIITLAICVISKYVINLDFGKFLVHTISYTFVLVFVTIFTFLVGLNYNILLIFAGGLFLIFISDLVLSMQYFGGKEDSKLLHIINHSLYYLGQITIVVFIFCFMLI